MSLYKDGGLSGSVLASIMYISKLPGMKINMSLTIKEDIAKNSAIPPHTPAIDLSFDDFLNFLFIAILPHL